MDVVATDGNFHVGAKNEYSASSEFIPLSNYVYRKQDITSKYAIDFNVTLQMSDVLCLL